MSQKDCRRRFCYRLLKIGVKRLDGRSPNHYLAILSESRHISQARKCTLRGLARRDLTVYDIRSIDLPLMTAMRGRSVTVIDDQTIVAIISPRF